MTDFSLDQVFEVSENVVSREVSGEFVLLDLESGIYFGLNPVGSRIWQLLDEKPQALSAICNIVEAEFDAPRDVIETDVLSLTGELVEQGLIAAQASTS
ncbi:MAG: PqqD family protein [Erythrobacter sp.]